MDRIKIPIYLSQTALEKIAVSFDLFPNFHNILKYHSILCVDMTDEKLDKELSNLESDISKFCNNNNIPTFALHSYFELLDNDFSILIEKPRSIFILNIDKERAKELTEKYGIIVESEFCINDRALQLDFDKGLRANTVLEGSDNGWHNLFKDLSFPPSNSLIVTDDFLLKNKSKNELIGLENLKQLLKVILPKKLETVQEKSETHFHLLIITPVPNIERKKIKKFPDTLKEYLSTIRSYDFQIEFVFTNTIHPRKIISNYFVIIFDHGIRTFYIKRANEVEISNEIRVKSILHDPQNLSSDTFLAISEMNIEELRKVCEGIQETALLENDPTKIIIGDCNKDKTIKNRLLNCKL